jgi:hypothetical protein
MRNHNRHKHKHSLFIIAALLYVSIVVSLTLSLLTRHSGQDVTMAAGVSAWDSEQN